MASASGQTGLRTGAVLSILGWAHSFILRQTDERYEITDPDGEGAVYCADWTQTERVLVRLGLPPHKIDEIQQLLTPGTDIVVRRTVG